MSIGRNHFIEWHRSRLVRGIAVCAGTALCLAVAAAVDRSAFTSAGVDLALMAAPKTQSGARKLLLDVAVIGSRWVTVGDAGRILVSDDEGKQWIQAESPTSVLLTAVDFAGDRDGWAVGHDGIILSTRDGGLHWVRQLDGTQVNDQMLNAAQAHAAKLAQVRGDQKPPARQQQDAERMLIDAQAAVQGGPSRPLLGLHFLDAQRGFVVGAMGQLLQTVDGGEHWQYIGDRLDNPEGLHLNSISASRDGDLYIAAEMGRVYRSHDGGRSWSASDLNYGGQLYGVLPLGSRGQDRALIAFGFNGHLFRSTDAGMTWNAVTSPVTKTLVHGVVLGGPRVLLVAQDGQLILSRDGGESFERLTERLARGSVSTFAVAGSRGLVVAVGSGGVATMSMAEAKAGQP